MLTRKNLVRIATIISEVEDHTVRWRLTSQMAEVLDTTNQRFDSQKFREACNPKGDTSDRHPEHRA
jgi:hypothetical protein